MLANSGKIRWIRSARAKKGARAKRGACAKRGARIKRSACERLTEIELQTNLQELEMHRLHKTKKYITLPSLSKNFKEKWFTARNPMLQSFKTRTETA